MKTFTPGTRVTLTDPEYGTWKGRVVVCLCKRHVWQPYILGRECGHAQCGYPRDAEACPWPMHVAWDGGNESHQGMAGLTAMMDDGKPIWDDHGPAHRRHVPERSGEAAIYSPEYLERKEGSRRGTEPERWYRYVH